jgi:hypothetical protein
VVVLLRARPPTGDLGYPRCVTRARAFGDTHRVVVGVPGDFAYRSLTGAVSCIWHPCAYDITRARSENLVREVFAVALGIPKLSVPHAGPSCARRAARSIFQIVDTYNPEIVYHECPGVPRNVQTLIYVGDDDDGAADVPARPPEPLGDPGAAMQREVED